MNKGKEKREKGEEKKDRILNQKKKKNEQATYEVLQVELSDQREFPFLPRQFQLAILWNMKRKEKIEGIWIFSSFFIRREKETIKHMKTRRTQQGTKKNVFSTYRADYSDRCIISVHYFLRPHEYHPPLHHQA